MKLLLTSGYQIILDLSHLLHNEQFPCELVVPSSCDLMAPAAWGSGGSRCFRNASSETLPVEIEGEALTQAWLSVINF